MLRSLNLENRFAGRRDELRPKPAYRWIVLAVASISAFGNMMSAGIVSVALPYMASDLHVGINRVQLVVSLFLLLISALLPMFGRLSDQIGRKRVFTTGFVLYILGASAGFAGNFPLLLFFRLVQAVGGGMLMATNMALVTLAFPLEERGRGLGSLSSMAAAGSMSGPAVGGLLIAAFGWRSVFWINFPIGLIGYLVAEALLVPDEKKNGHEPFDYPGAAVFGAMVVLLLVLLSEGPTWGWDSARTLATVGAAALTVILFIHRERRIPWPMVDLSLFRIPVFTLGNISGFLLYVIQYFNIILTPFYLQRVMGYSPAAVGLLMVPTPLVTTVTSPLAGWMSDRIGYMAPTTIGMGIMGVSMYLIGGLGASSGYLAVVVRLAILGLGIALFNSPNNSSIMTAVPKTKVGITSSLVATVRNIGQMAGTAMAASLFTAWAGAAAAATSSLATVDTKLFLSAFAKVFDVGALLGLVGMAVCLIRAGQVKGTAAPSNEALRL